MFCLLFRSCRGRFLMTNDLIAINDGQVAAIIAVFKGDQDSTRAAQRNAINNASKSLLCRIGGILLVVGKKYK